jgi:hypothetical protein
MSTLNPRWIKVFRNAPHRKLYHSAYKNLMHIKQQKLSGKATYTMFEKMRKREKLKQGRDVFSEVFLIGLWICLNFHAVDAVYSECAIARLLRVL